MLSLQTCIYKFKIVFDQSKGMMFIFFFFFKDVYIVVNNQCINQMYKIF